MKQSTDRLAKRKWLIDNFDSLLEELTYHKEHSAEFSLPASRCVGFEDGETTIAFTE